MHKILFFVQHKWFPWIATLLVATLLICGVVSCNSESYVIDDRAFEQAIENGRLANEGFKRSRRFVAGWLEHVDPNTGLIPVKLDDEGWDPEDANIWNPEDAAADNYPFMVLTAALTNRPRFEGRMHEILRTEKELTSRLGNLPDTYSFSKQAFQEEKADLGKIIFKAQEYAKDGLMPLTEWLGPSSPWTDRMIGIVDDLWKRAPVETKYGKIISTDHEINGEALQTLPRIYWMTGDRKYLEYAIRLGDYYLLDKHHPTRDAEKLSLLDHGSEIISGLTELYATVHFVRPEKKRAYKKPIHDMLNRILEVGRNEHGMLYDVIDPQSGEILDEDIVHSWGYVYNAFYTVYQIDSTEAYREAVRGALASLNEHYSAYGWKHTVGGDADAIESAINLYNREPIASTEDWMDTEMKVMWGKQSPTTGIFEGWYGDGNVARTTLMYCLWKTQGLHITSWREDVVFGAVQRDKELAISMSADEAWTGALIFDRPRHKAYMGMPLDWARINQFPEWFTVEAERSYIVHDVVNDTRTTYIGKELQEGIQVHLQPDTKKRFIVSRKDA